MSIEGPSTIELPGGVKAPAGSLRIQFSRGGGPGGQNVNKVNTKAELWLDVSSLTGLSNAARLRLFLIAAPHLTSAGEIHLWSTTHRTQHRNRDEVLDKLRDLILGALVEPKKRRKTRPTAASRRRRLEAKHHRGQIKADRRGGDF